MSELTTIKDLLEDELKDLYSAENQLTKAIPKMAKGSNNKELASAFEAHLKETQGQITRLEEVAKLLDTTLTGKSATGWRESLKKGQKRLRRKVTRTFWISASSERAAALNTTK